MNFVANVEDPLGIPPNKQDPDPREASPEASPEQAPRSAPPSKAFIKLVAYCASPVVLLPLVEYLAVAPVGSHAFLMLEGLLVPLLLIAAAWVVIPLVLIFFPKHRAVAARNFTGAVVLLGSSFVGFMLGGEIRQDGFERLAARSAPLVEAIRSYEAKHGQPPPDLAALVPDFLPAVPGTGIGAYPEYTYYVGEKARRFNDNPWALEVFTPSGGINFDTFLYFPLQNYPKHGHGGSLERIGDWAYVHE
jgi:hypothetical protein